MPFSTIFQLYRKVSFIGGGNRSTLRKPLTCRKSLILLKITPNLKKIQLPQHVQSF